ncbi:hypothetical protein O9X98_04210 [Agrobacterium salinitolerans]|nr:hypothetical protein [Agrobacterium salinitolerans]
MTSDGLSFIDAFSCLTIRKDHRARHMAILTSKVSERVISTASGDFFKQTMGRSFADPVELSAWLSSPGSRVRLKSGVFDGRGFVLNTALANDALRVLARIEGGCDVGTFVACKDRPWFAGLVRRAMGAGLIDGEAGFRNLPILVETETESDLVIASPSSGLSFPSHPDDVATLRTKGLTGISPDGWSEFRFPAIEG